MAQDELEDAPRARIVRPYTITAGRTEATVDLPMEATLVKIEGTDAPQFGPHAQALAYCTGQSVAEVSAKMHQPIGVVRVLLSDLVEQGHLRVQGTLSEDASRDERRELIERTLRGLRAL